MCVDVVVREEEVRPARARRCARPERRHGPAGCTPRCRARTKHPRPQSMACAAPAPFSLETWSGLQLPLSCPASEQQSLLLSCDAAALLQQASHACEEPGDATRRGALPPHPPFLRSMTGSGRGGHTVHPRLSLICGGGCQARSRRGKTKAALRCCWSVSVLQRACRATAAAGGGRFARRERAAACGGAISGPHRPVPSTRAFRRRATSALYDPHLNPSVVAAS